MRAKKSLGQNFLKSKQAVRSIIASADLHENDVVLEVGPGKGVLTEELLKSSASKVVAIEKDDALVPFLADKFKNEIAAGKLELIHGDILEFKPSEHGLSEHNYKLVANIPYYITGALVRMFLSTNIPQPSRMVLMLQKEVADRIVARDNKESLLSLSVKAYGTPHYIEKVAAKYFSPEPNVDSAIILIENISRSFFKDFSEETFFKLIHLAFAHKRKQLAGNMTSEKLPREQILKILSILGLSTNIRAEDVPLETWKKIALETALVI